MTNDTHLLSDGILRIKDAHKIGVASNGTYNYYGIICRDYGWTYCFIDVDGNQYYVHNRLYYDSKNNACIKIEYMHSSGVYVKSMFELDTIENIHTFIRVLKVLKK